MDKELGCYPSLITRTKHDEEIVPFLSDQNYITGFKGSGGAFLNHKYLDIPLLSPNRNSNLLIPPSVVTAEGNSNDGCDFRDGVLKYINQMLMEEDMEEKTCMFQESAALQAAEKSFSEALGEEYAPSPYHHEIHYMDPKDENSIVCYHSNHSNYSSSVSGRRVGLSCDHVEYEQPLVKNVAVEFILQSTSMSSFSPSNSGAFVDGLADSLVTVPAVEDIFTDTDFVQSQSGVREEGQDVVVKLETKYEREYSLDGSSGKRSAHPQQFALEEGRSNKQPALYAETSVTPEMFDMVLLGNGERSESSLREVLQNGVDKNLQQNGQSKGSHSGKGRGTKWGGKRVVVDLATLLTQCAQAVSNDDRSRASGILKQIRQHSCPTGDGMQRMAHYFANGLEARMDGSGSQSYKAVITKPTSAAEILKAYHLFLACCPFRKVSNFFANKTIMNVSEKVSRLHIIDFGILYGFHWPNLIQRLSSRPGGPPEVRITGIDLPNSGFRPAERVEETGRRLANYAKSFNVPFEFHAIAQKWETIQIEDLKLDRDELLVVNCQCRFRNILDETVGIENPREIVLKLIRKLNPEVFIHHEVNGSFSGPFFISRFREAMYHYSALFDMLENNVPRDMHERMLIEKQIFGWEAINVIACEGAERIERPETYKQWQVRNLRVGFSQLPLDREIMSMAKERVNALYHKDFLIDDDGHWILLGWKGRIIQILSSWK